MPKPNTWLIGWRDDNRCPSPLHWCHDVLIYQLNMVQDKGGMRPYGHYACKILTQRIIDKVDRCEIESYHTFEH